MQNITKENLSKILKINVISIKIVDDTIFYSAECGKDFKNFSIKIKDLEENKGKLC